jgi:glutathione synthase/RimK-type ligase-like ATP-grasp enzyme
MKICVLYPDACSESARELARALGATAANPYKDYAPRADWYFNYGTEENASLRKQINTGGAVLRCIDKHRTFEKLSHAGVPVPTFTTDSKVASKWERVVCRSTVEGRGNEGMSYWYQWDGGKPRGKLFTEYFEHVAEYRIVVFMGKVVGRYRKDIQPNGNWNFTLMTLIGFRDVDRSCIQAAQALGIDYVGFDVLENKKGVYVVLEANSGPILTEESKKAIVKHFKQLNK